MPEADGCRRCGMDAEKYPIIYENGIPIAIIQNVFDLIATDEAGG